MRSKKFLQAEQLGLVFGHHGRIGNARDALQRQFFEASVRRRIDPIRSRERVKWLLHKIQPAAVMNRVRAAAVRIERRLDRDHGDFLEQAVGCRSVSTTQASVVDENV